MPHLPSYQNPNPVVGDAATHSLPTLHTHLDVVFTVKWSNFDTLGGFK